MQKWLIDNALKLVGLGILLVALVIGAFALKNVYDDYKAGKLTIAQQDRTMEATGDIAAGISTANQSAIAAANQVDNARVDYYHHYEELRNANPAIADVLDTPIPDELRLIAQCRELARERSGSVAAGDSCYDRAASGAGANQDNLTGEDSR